MSPGQRSFAELLDRLDVRAGDVIYLHTSFKRLVHLGLSAADLLESLIDRLGASGTLAAPSFAWNLDRTVRPWKGYADYFRLCPVFDVRNTPANIGLVPETFRRIPGVHRSLDYWWPICVRGPLAVELTSGQEAVPHPYGPESCFDRLRLAGVNILGLGVSLNTTSLALVPDFQLGDEHPHAVFTDWPQTGIVIDHSGRRLTTCSYWLLPDVVRLIKPSAVFELSPVLREATRRADEGETIHFYYPYSVYHDEAMRLGRQAARSGQPLPWLRDFPAATTKTRGGAA
jgi:hypothetical protein